jgi:hypothetical protein
MKPGRSIGGGTLSRLLLPVLPGNDLHAALPQVD